MAAMRAAEIGRCLRRCELGDARLIADDIKEFRSDDIATLSHKYYESVREHLACLLA